MRVPVVFASVGLVWASIATPAAAAPLQPTSSWNLDYGETQCAAGRSYGKPSKPITLVIVPTIGGENYRLLVSVPTSGPASARQFEGAVDFDGKKTKGWLLKYGAKGVQMTNYQMRVPAAEMEKARSATSVALRGDRGWDVQFALSDMPAVLDALEKCTLDLQAYWHRGDKTVVRTTTTDQRDARALFTGDDYPGEALVRGQEGTAQYELLVNEAGIVAGCDVPLPSGVPALDVMGCEVLQKRAKFSPAIDAEGKPVRTVITTPPVTWRIEGDGSMMTTGSFTLGGLMAQ